MADVQIHATFPHQRVASNLPQCVLPQRVARGSSIRQTGASRAEEVSSKRQRAPSSLDHDFLRADDQTTDPPPDRPKTGLWIVAGLLVAASLAAVYVIFLGRATRQESPVAEPAASRESKPNAVAPLGGGAMA